MIAGKIKLRYNFIGNLQPGLVQVLNGVFIIVGDFNHTLHIFMIFIL